MPPGSGTAPSSTDEVAEGVALAPGVVEAAGAGPDDFTVFGMPG